MPPNKDAGDPVNLGPGALALMLLAEISNILIAPSYLDVSLQAVIKGTTSSSHRPGGSTPPFLSTVPEALSADFDSIWTSVSVWKGGSMVKRITQNSPMRCSVTPCQFFSSIPPSILPSFARSSFHLPVCGYLCPFLPPSRRYCPSVACFPHPSPFSLRQPPITTSNLHLGT